MRLVLPLVLLVSALAFTLWVRGRGDTDVDGFADGAEIRNGAGGLAQDLIAVLVGRSERPLVQGIVTFGNPGGDADLDDLAIAIRANLVALERRIGARVQMLDAETIDDTDLCSSVAGSSWVHEGSLHRLQGTIGVNARFTRCPEGTVRWSDSWDYSHDDLASIAADVASNVVAGTQLVDIYDPDAPHSVRWYLRKLERKSTEEALTRVEEAIGLYPDEAGRFDFGLFEIHLQILREGWGDPPSESVAALDRLAASVLDADRQYFLAHGIAGWAAFFKGDREGMLRSFARAVELSDLPVAHGWLCEAHAAVGHTEEALESAATAIAKSPSDVLLVDWLRCKSRAYFAAAQYTDSHSAALEAINLNENSMFNIRANAFLQLAASSAYIPGREEEASEALENARKLRPGLDESGALAYFAVSDRELRDRYINGLRMAGLED